MNRLFSLPIRMSLGLTSLFMSVFLLAVSLDFVPNGAGQGSGGLVELSNTVAARLVEATSRNDAKALNETIKSLLAEHPELASIGVRLSDGVLFAGSTEHSQLWSEAGDGAGTTTQMVVDLFASGQRKGQIEVKVKPEFRDTTISGFDDDVVRKLALVGSLCFLATYVFLRRVLKELDPGNVVPERVQAAFDTMTECILLLDLESNILLANRSLRERLGTTSDELIGLNVDRLPWHSGEASPIDAPWVSVLASGAPLNDQKLELLKPDGSCIRFVSHVAPIRDNGGAMRGVIVTLDDVTELFEKNETLRLANKRLEEQQLEIQHRNEELKFLATRDTLTGCLNRRAFFDEANGVFETAAQAGTPICCLMVDLDHFKAINDTFGHSMGDRVISEMGKTLASQCRSTDLICRYGGEEFCVVMPQTTEEEALELAEAIRKDIERRSPAWFSGERTVTSSVGLASNQENCPSLADLINEADVALYSAKHNGRNRVVMSSALKSAETERSPRVRMKDRV